jgi:outer membrane protein assembly factor BamB
MKHWQLFSSATLAASCLLFTHASADKNADRYWGQWRGPLGTGVASHADPPVEWSESKNIRWKIPLPGMGHSTPIVWGDRVYVSAAVGVGEAVDPVHTHTEGAHDYVAPTQSHKFLLLAINRADGKIVWERTLREEIPHEGMHNTGSMASNSPVTDGEHLFAFFGSRGLYGLDMDGNVLWEKDLGEMKTKHAHGEGSSPALFGDTLVVNWDHEGESFVVAFDKRTGGERWKVARDEVSSWSTPLVVVHDGKPQVIIAATKRMRAYDLATGEVIWECAGLSSNVVASPVSADGMVYAGSSYDFQAMLAIRLDGAKGDITDSENVVWTLDRLTPYVPSPLLYADTLYFIRHNQGTLSVLDAKTGETTAGPFRLNGIRNVFASPVGAANRVYITDRSGSTLVLSHGTTPEFLALNELDDSFSASPALVENELYLRGERYLYCITRARK